MEDSNANQVTSQSPIASRSGGPRTAEGKRRSCQNAQKHGLYTDERFLEAAALELGDDPRQFQRLLNGLIEARRPVGAVEMALVEGIALLLYKQARLDRSELAVQVSNLHHHDLARRKLSIQVGTGNSDAVELEVQEKGLRRFASSPPDPGTPAAVNPSTTGMAQTSSGEVCDVPKGQAGTPIAGGTAERDERGSALLIWMVAVLAAAFKKIGNRGNELKDLLQRQGITEIAASKRTRFRPEKAAIGAERSVISRIVGGRLAVPWAGAILHGPG
jgi:hypothetical protein